MGFNKRDKINTLAALAINDNNISQTSEEFGITRKTLYRWIEQMENDVKLLAQVEAVKQNLANLEELQAIKAQAELSKRLDEKPEGLATKDLITIKDSGIKNSRLIRGESTANIGTPDQNSPEAICRRWVAAFIGTKVERADGSLQTVTISEALSALERYGLEGVDEGFRLAYVERERKGLIGSL